MKGISLTAHYTNKNEEKTKIATDYLMKYSKNNEIVIALPEEDSLYIDNEKLKILGTKPFYIFKNGHKIFIEKNKEFTINELKNI